MQSGSTILNLNGYITSLRPTARFLGGFSIFSNRVHPTLSNFKVLSNSIYTYCSICSSFLAESMIIGLATVPFIQFWEVTIHDPKHLHDPATSAAKIIAGWRTDFLSGEMAGFRSNCMQWPHAEIGAPKLRTWTIAVSRNELLPSCWLPHVAYMKELPENHSESSCQGLPRLKPPAASRIYSCSHLPRVHRGHGERIPPSDLGRQHNMLFTRAPPGTMYAYQIYQLWQIGQVLFFPRKIWKSWKF